MLIHKYLAQTGTVSPWGENSVGRNPPNPPPTPKASATIQSWVCVLLSSLTAHPLPPVNQSADALPGAVNAKHSYGMPAQC